MQQTLLQISQEIDQQKQALTQQVEDAFAQYLQPSAPQPTVVQKRSIPPISYILGGIAAFLLCLFAHVYDWGESEYHKGSSIIRMCCGIGMGSLQNSKTCTTLF